MEISSIGTKAIVQETEKSTNAEDEHRDSNGSFLERNRTEGHVVECDGERAIVAANAGAQVAGSDDYWAVGQLISVQVGTSRIVGLIYQVDIQNGYWNPEKDNTVHIHIELVGEIQTLADGKESFTSGIANYPYMGAIAHRIRTADLTAIYASSTESTTSIGNLSQDTSIPALITIDKLLSRHFAVVGTTGVGKSTAVTLLLRKIVEQRPDIRVLILDPHNEFTTAFPDHAITIDASTLELPFWMFQLEEFVEVLFRGHPIVPEEVDALRDFIALAKERYASDNSGEQKGLLKRDREFNSVTADTPLPYRMTDLLAIIREREGQLESKTERPALRTLRNRLEAIMQDSRFRFMFQPKTLGDTLERTIGEIFRIPSNGKPICVFEMSGLPSEVMNSVVSVLARFAFDIGVNSKGSIPTLLVCEEAHRYIPADINSGFWPTRSAIARIAKEGRKYGVFLSVITQRPGELDPTILSQCNSIFAMRLGNEHDKEIIRQAISGAGRSTTSFLSSIANREAIAFGEAVSTPMRMVFETVSKNALPGSHIYDMQEKLRNGSNNVRLSDVVRRMRKLDDTCMGVSSKDKASPELSVVGEKVDEQKPSTQRLTSTGIARPAPAAAAAPSAPAAATMPAASGPDAISNPPAPAPQMHSRQFNQDTYAGTPAQPSQPSPAGDGGASNLIRSFRNRN